jgi:hypothetical protein
MAEPKPVDPKRVAAVRKVLYQRSRMRRIVDHLDSIVALMNLDPAGRSPGPGIPPGSGPHWYVPATGKISPSVLEAADRCDKVSALLLEIRDELAHVDFPSPDKQHLRAGLAEQAAALRARAKVWRAPAPPGDVQAAVAPIAAHERASLNELEHVAPYLKKVDLGTLR